MRLQVNPTPLETCELLVGRAQVVEAVERAKDAAEASAEVERRHVPGDQRDPLTSLRRLESKLASAVREHLRGQVDAGDLVPGSRERQQYAARPAAKLQKRAIRRGISHRPPQSAIVNVGVDGVVDLRELGCLIRGVVVDAAPRSAREPVKVPSW